MPPCFLKAINNFYEVRLHMENFFGFISAWILGVFTQSFTNDGEAIALCRMDLLELEKLMEELRKMESHQSQADVAKKIKEIKEILRILNVHYAGLFIKCPELEELIESSLKRIREWEKNPHEPQNLSSFVGVDLSMDWGYSDGHSELQKIKEIRGILHQGFIGRAFYRTIEIFHKFTVAITS